MTAKEREKEYYYFYHSKTITNVDCKCNIKTLLDSVSEGKHSLINGTSYVLTWEKNKGSFSGFH